MKIVKNERAEEGGLHAGRSRAGKARGGMLMSWRRRSLATIKWYTQERDPEGLRRVVRKGPVLRGGSPVVRARCKCRSLGSTLAESRGGAAGAASARAVDGGPPPGARDAARGGRCGILSATNIGRLTAICGMLGGVAAVSQAQPGWMPVRVCLGEGGAIRWRSQTELDTPSVEDPVEPPLRTRPTVALPIRQHLAAIAT